MLELLPITIISLSWLSVVSAGSANFGDSCKLADNRLQVGTYQFYTDCNSVTYCASNSTCAHRGCRKDDFPFGYQNTSTFPPKCSIGQFCPDEMDACQDVMPVGSACQMNRDGGGCNFFILATIIWFSVPFCRPMSRPTKLHGATGHHSSWSKR